MTLLLSLVGESGIHLSSDFRLTNITTRQPIEDELGSKQLYFPYNLFAAHVSFTGIAQINEMRTVDWISRAMFGLPQFVTVCDAMLELEKAATAQFKLLPNSLKQLTVVIAATMTAEPAKLFVITCNADAYGRRLAEPLEAFATYEFGTSSHQVLIYGYEQAVSTTDRRFLKNLNRSHNPEEVREAMARVNARSAKNSNGTVSTGCLVTSILRGGHAAFQNFGRTPGLYAPGTKHLLRQVLPGEKLVVVQGGEVRGSGKSTLTAKPMNVTKGNALIVQINSDKPPLFLTDSAGNTFTSAPSAYWWSVPPEEEELEYENTNKDKKVGDLRIVELAPGKAHASIITATGSVLGSISIDGVEKQLSLRKNKIAIDILNTISIELDPAVDYKGPFHTMLEAVPCLPTVDGIRPHGWSYAIDMAIDEMACTLSLRKMSMAFRSANYPGGMKLLSSLEELVMVAPRRRIELKVSKTTSTAAVNIEARFLLRDLDG